MKIIASVADFNEMRGASRALVFIYVEWAVQAHKSESALLDFLATIQHEFQNEPIPVYRIDLSDQEGEVWRCTRAWLTEQHQPSDLLSYGGNGPLLWVRLSAVVSHVPYLAAAKCDELIAVTRRVFDLEK